MGKIKCELTHREAVEKIVTLIEKYTIDPHCPGTDHSWEIGINENGEPDATCDALKDHFGAMTIPVVFYDTTDSDPVDLVADDEMNHGQKYDYYIDMLMETTPDGFENLEFKTDD